MNRSGGLIGWLWAMLICSDVPFARNQLLWELVGSLDNFGFPGCTVVKKCTCQCRRWGFNSLGLEDPLEEEIATYPSILAWKVQWTEKTSGLHTVHGATKSHTWLSMHVDGFSGQALNTCSQGHESSHKSPLCWVWYWKCCFPHCLSVESDLSYPGKAAGRAVLRKEAWP